MKIILKNAPYNTLKGRKISKIYLMQNGFKTVLYIDDYVYAYLHGCRTNFTMPQFKTLKIVTICILLLTEADFVSDHWGKGLRTTA